MPKVLTQAEKGYLLTQRRLAHSKVAKGLLHMFQVRADGKLKRADVAFFFKNEFNVSFNGEWCCVSELIAEMV